VKNVGVLFNILNEAFDLRRAQFSQRTSDSYEDEEVDDIENAVNEVTIKMIYKLNDTTFRPLFAKLTEWATNGLSEKDATGRTMRLTTFYKFLDMFFSTLKVSRSGVSIRSRGCNRLTPFLQSIVTGYASYILENAVDVLKQARPVHKDSKPLWLSVLRTLRNAFENDQDGRHIHPFSPCEGPLN
jgi:U3 small nucleolar RNA-associated protein 10